MKEAIYFVSRKNPYKRRGTWVHGSGDGYQEIEVGEEDGRMIILSYVGLVYERRTLGPYLTMVRKNGLDWGSWRGDRLRHEGGVVDEEKAIYEEVMKDVG